jgi:hypothetical protein
LREIALHLLDIAENSVAAQASTVTISVCENLVDDTLSASVRDNGRGMDRELLARVTDPFVTSRTTRKVGLGIPLLKAAAEACNGHLLLDSKPGEGTYLEVEFQRSHIDRMPLGDISGTFLTLIVAYPQINWVFNYKMIQPEGEKEYNFNDEPIKEFLEDVPLCEPEVLSYLRELLEGGISDLQKTVGEPIALNQKFVTRRKSNVTN